MHAQQHYAAGEDKLQRAQSYPHGHTSHIALLAEATAHFAAARAAAEPGRNLEHEWCDTCDGSGYAPPAA